MIFDKEEQMTREEIKAALQKVVPARAEYGTVKIPSRLELIRKIAQYLATKPRQPYSVVRWGRPEY